MVLSLSVMRCLQHWLLPSVPASGFTLRLVVGIGDIIQNRISMRTRRLARRHRGIAALRVDPYIDLHCKFFPEFVRLFIFRLRDIQGVSWSPVRLCRPFSRDCCSCCRCCNGSSCSCSNCLSRVPFELLLTIDIFAAFLEGVKNVSPRRKRLLERGDITKPDTDQNRRRACKSLLRLPLACTGLPITVARVR